MAERKNEGLCDVCEFGARELRRQIRSAVETQLAQGMLRGEVAESDTVRFLYDQEAGKVRWEKQGAAVAARGEGSPARQKERRAP
jgi:ATP-dependent Clp protease ATP-binding subunit ClpC